MPTITPQTTRTHVLKASYEGFRAAITPSVASRFSWESVNDGPALLFLGTGQVPKAGISQDTWFEFDATLQSVRYIVRITELDEEQSNYGDSRGIFEAEVTLEEAANLLEMCVYQALAENALDNRRQSLNAIKLRDD